jgi:hypothetical protein
MTRSRHSSHRLQRAARTIERMQLEAEAAAAPMSAPTFRMRREEAVLDALLFAVSSIARPEGAWRYEVDDEQLRDIVGHLLEAMSVVRALPVVPAPEHASAVDQVRRHTAATEDAAFQRLLRGLNRNSAG